jgi:hypothetical protein
LSAPVVRRPGPLDAGLAAGGLADGLRRTGDIALFLDLPGQSVAKFDVELWGYCLMGHHWRRKLNVEG